MQPKLVVLSLVGALALVHVAQCAGGVKGYAESSAKGGRAYEPQQQQQQQEELAQQQLAEEHPRELAAVQPALPLLEPEGPLRLEQQRADYTGAAPPGQAEPYAFSYQVEGSSRTESSDANGVVRGQYTLQGADGAARVVDYVADANGFRASINTNEFGTENRSPAGVALRSSQPLAEDITLRLEGKTREDLLAPAVAAAPSGVKGAPALVQKVEQWSVKGQQPLAPPAPQLPAGPPAPIPVAPSAPVAEAKGHRIVQQQQQQEEEAQAEVERVEQAPTKGAPAPVERAESAKGHDRAPKALAEVKQAAAPVVQPALVRGFESASAHQPVVGVPRAPVIHHQPGVAPVVPSIRTLPLAPIQLVRSHVVAPPARTGLVRQSYQYLRPLSHSQPIVHHNHVASPAYLARPQAPSRALRAPSSTGYRSYPSQVHHYNPSLTSYDNDDHLSSFDQPIDSA